MSTLKLEILSNKDIPPQEKPKSEFVTMGQLENYLTGSANPLHDISPPKNTVEVQSDILLQAKDIKETLEKTFFTDSTARAHTFPYLIYAPNKKLLEQQGFKLHSYKGDERGLELFTEVSWDNAKQMELVIPM
jgi:hypothetical protein